MSSSVIQSKQTITKIDNVETKLLEENGTDQVVTLIPSSTPKSPSTHVYFKYMSLIIYVLNNVIRSTLLRYTRTQSGPRYIGSTFVLFGEIQKAIFSIFLIFGQEGNILIGLKKVIRVFVKEPYVTIKICVIGLVYIIQNNLNLYAVSKLDIPTYAVTNQLKILTTAIFTRFLLNRRFNIIQWFALILLIIGIAIVEIQVMTSKKEQKDVEPVTGFLAVIVCCICSGFAGVYSEKIVKNTEISLWIYNIQLATCSIIFSALLMGIKDGHEIKTRGILYGYTTLVWISLLLHSIGGLIVGLVIKYSDNILKGFAASSSVVLACIIAIVCFDFQLSILFSIGSSLVILSIIIYSNSEFISTIPIFKLVFKDKPIYI